MIFTIGLMHLKMAAGGGRHGKNNIPVANALQYMYMDILFVSTNDNTILNWYLTNYHFVTQG